MTINEESWDLDSDEIRSIDSDELYESRPNRWKGSKSTWQTYTQEERLIHRSLEQVRNRDLSVHLYNAFALKNRPARPAGGATDLDPEVSKPATRPKISPSRPLTHTNQDGERSLEELVADSDWRPPNLWTAWPMNAKTVPGDDFMKETHDEDDEFTVRSNAPQMPSTGLEEEITAAVLRQAKDRFRRRQEKRRQKEAAAAAEQSVPETTAASTDVTADDEDGSSSDTDPAPNPAEETQKVKPVKTYKAVVSADDDLSAKLLRPSVRHILSMLDNTLTTLHNARLAGLSYMTDSSASATDVEDATDAGSISSSASKRGRRGRRRSRAPRLPTPQRNPSERRGRPKKAHVPLPGETEKEMQVRIAREQKKRIPFSSDEEDNAAEGDDGAEPDSGNEDDVHEEIIFKTEDTGDEGLPVTSPPKSRSRSPRKKKREPPSAARLEAKIKVRENMLGSWGLRDWSDVIGAASLSGFKPEVVARAAQRCADLFGQGMETQTLLEGPASKGPKPQKRRYVPGQQRQRAASVSSSEGEPAVPPRFFQRAGSRGRDSVPPSDPDTARGRTARSSSRRRSVSRSSSVGLFLCPVAGCERAVEGFGRKANLQRHVGLVHPGQAVDVDDVESENEMFGAVHVDGFMKPIRARKGWRAEDTGTRKRKRHYRGRRVDGDAEESGVGEESFWGSS